MTYLRLRVNKHLMGQELPEFGAIANIYPLPEKQGERAASRKPIRNLLVPAGSGSGYKEVTLDPGRYLVEAVLPSGETLQDEVMIPESGPPIELQLRGESSPHEWLSGQHFYGMVQGAERYDQPGSVRQPKGIPSMVATLVSAVTDRSPARTPSGDLIARGLFFALPQVKSLASGRPLGTALPFDEMIHPAVETGPLRPFQEDALSITYRFGSSDLPAAPGSDGRSADYTTEPFVRRYLFASSAQVPPQYCVLPAPWIVSDGSHEAEVEVLVQRRGLDAETSPGFDQGYRLAVAVSDEVVGAMLGYLGSGRVDAAVSIIQQARDRLWEKRVNPLAAAAGAYVMIAGWQPSQAAYWHNWVRNLMNGFPWLPDGAIQYAWLQLTSGRSPETLSEARRALLEAYRRGLPFFSKGVSLLLDGLSMFANDAREAGAPDVEVEAALKIVRLMALRTSMRQPFTTVLL